MHVCKYVSMCNMIWKKLEKVGKSIVYNYIVV